MTPRSVYIHVPFCGRRCGYCNFALVAGRDDLVAGYLQALQHELATTLVQPANVDTIFLGGGTPSHLSPVDLRQLLTLVTEWFAPTASAEFSCEVNPMDCDAQRLGLLSQYGVNRISLGGQSFNDAKLAVLERDHHGRQLRDSINLCCQVFDNVSLDLIFAAPNESLSDWQRDIEVALQFPLRHLSTYGLTIERGSAFYGRRLRKEIEELDEDVQLAMYEHTLKTLSQTGWEHYEVSNFARTGYRCRHNEAYWLGHTWWGFGPGAASFLPSDRDHTYLRQVNHRSPTTYIRRQLEGRCAVAERDEIGLEQYVRERLVFGLRRLAGLSLTELNDVYGSSVRPLFEPYLQQYLDMGLLTLDAQNTLRLSRQGLLVSDSLWPELLGDT